MKSFNALHSTIAFLIGISIGYVYALHQTEKNSSYMQEKSELEQPNQVLESSSTTLQTQKDINISLNGEIEEKRKDYLLRRFIQVRGPNIIQEDIKNTLENPGSYINKMILAVRKKGGKKMHTRTKLLQQELLEASRNIEKYYDKQMKKTYRSKDLEGLVLATEKVKEVLAISNQLSRSMRMSQYLYNTSLESEIAQRELDSKVNETPVQRRKKILQLYKIFRDIEVSSKLEPEDSIPMDVDSSDLRQEKLEKQKQKIFIVEYRFLLDSEINSLIQYFSKDIVKREIEIRQKQQIIFRDLVPKFISKTQKMAHEVEETLSSS